MLPGPCQPSIVDGLVPASILLSPSLLCYKASAFVARTKCPLKKEKRERHLELTDHPGGGQALDRNYIFKPPVSSWADEEKSVCRQTVWGPSLVMCLVIQLCPTLCDPMDSSPSGSSVHGIFQARILEQVAISSSRGSSQPRDRTRISCVSCIAR